MVQTLRGEKQRLKSGRRPRSLSRAAEIRARLAEWKQSQEPRISLRALAAEIGASHQLLSFYLRHWDKWQEREYQRQAKAIRDNAKAERRSMSESELERVLAYQQAASRCMFSGLLDELYRDFEADARGGKLHPKMAGFLATHNDPRAQKVLRLSKRPQKRKGLDAVLEELNRTTDSEKALSMIRQLTPEEREEFRASQEKRSGVKKSKNNLPLASPRTRKSFRSV